MWYSSIPPETNSLTPENPRSSSSHLTSRRMARKSPRRLAGVSRRTAPSRLPTTRAASSAPNFSSWNVSTNATRGTRSSITLSKARHARSSPRMMMSAWAMVPTGSWPISSALFTAATPSHPPMYAARSIIGAMAGCIRRAPNEYTGLLRAARRQRAAMVAIPLAWHSRPSSAVSRMPKSRYRPERTITGSST